MDALPEWTLNGAESPRYHGNLNIRREGVNGLRLMSDARNVAFSLGSACGSGSGKVSHVLRAMGVSEADARASIRLGWGRYRATPLPGGNRIKILSTGSAATGALAASSPMTAANCTALWAKLPPFAGSFPTAP